STSTRPTFDQANAPVKGLTASSDLYVTEEPQRFAFAVLDSRGEEETYVLGEPVSIAFQGPDGQRIPAQDAVWRTTSESETHLHADGEEHVHEGGLGIYTVEAIFDAPGVWFASVAYDSVEGPLPIEVRPEPLAPIAGQEAVVTPSPTPEEPLGVDPICTRDPACSLHDVSLDDAMAGDLPVAVLFATPARCTSRWCGPVLDTMLDVAGDYEGRIRFVHVEIYQDLQSNDLVPTMQEWGLHSEPWLFRIGTDGRITGRLDSAFDQAEMRELLDALVA
ncbi:MAG TPA: hypothetical protein VM618_01880, partial [Acidimicrobiia bacterium]|nr:hypothetical protein [Acidimicrobiia bacterium]